MTPLVDQERLIVVTHDRKVVVLQAKTGSVEHVVQPPEGHGVGYQGVIAVGDALVVLDDRGEWFTLGRARPSDPLQSGTWGDVSRSTPTFGGGRTFIRTLGSMIAYE
jgi:hypothetical protein